MPIAGPIIGAVGAIGGGLLASGGAKSAANAEAAAQQAALDEQGREFNINQQNYAPWLAAGKNALSQQLALLGLGGTPATAGGLVFNPATGGFTQSAGSPGVSGADAQQTAINQLQQSPLYQSLFRNGQDTVLNNAAATGGLRGGNTQRSLYNLGSDTLAQVIQQQLSNLGGISGNGMSSAGSLGSLNGNSANAMSQLLAAKGSAQAGGIAGSAGIWNNAFNGVSRALGSSGLFNSAPLLGSNGIVTPTPGLISSAGTVINDNAGLF